MSLIQQAVGSLLNSSNNVAGVLTSAALAQLFPDQYANYSITLQVIAGSGQSSGPAIASMTFPVMPQSMVLAQQYLMTVTPTLAGVYVDDFGAAPSPITLSGTFGQNLKTYVGAGSAAANLFGGIGGPSTFPVAATGYGMAKQLYKLVGLSHEIGADGTLPVVQFYNWAFNVHWEVVIDGLTTRMDVNNNLLWFYQLQMRTLRSISDSLAGSSDTMLMGVAQSLAGTLLTSQAAAVVAGISGVVGLVNTPSAPVQYQPALNLNPGGNV